jgi:hypothetical protein
MKVVELSKQFAVASQPHVAPRARERGHVQRVRPRSGDGVAPVFTGEHQATSSSSDAENELGAGEDALASEEAGDFDRSKDEKKSRDVGFPDADKATMPGGSVGSGGKGGGFGPSATASAGAPPAPMEAPMAKAPAQKPSIAADDPFDPSWGRRQPTTPARPRPMIPMKKVFDRKASFSSEKLLATEVAKLLVDAETALKLSPESRDKTVLLYKALMASGRVGEALELASKWSNKDALDPDALIARADLAAMNGDRERALRILSGLADVRPSDKSMQKRLATVFTQMGAPDLACQHQIALADLDAKDTSAVAAALRCSQDQGLSNLGQTLLASAPSKDKDKIENIARSLKPSELPALLGDLRVTATWTAPVDLDLAIIDKNGKRLSWLGSAAPNLTVRAKDATSTSTETLSLSGMPSGNFMVEVVRAKSSASSGPITGELTFTLPGGETRKVPFTVTNQRAEVGSLRVFFTSRLVPLSGGPGGWR